MFLVFILLSAGLGARADLAGIEYLEEIPIQHGGRVKPLGTLARETLSIVTGKQKFRDKNPTEVLISWVLAPEEWLQIPMITIHHKGLRELLALVPSDPSEFSIDDLRKNPKVAELFQKIETERKSQPRLSPALTQGSQLQTKMSAFAEIASGQAWRLMPSHDSETWKSLLELDDTEKAETQKLFSAFIRTIKTPTDTQPLQDATRNFRVFALSRGNYVSADLMKIEMLYNKTSPFSWAGCFYALSAILLGFSLGLPKRSKLLWRLGMSSLFGGFIVHGLGFGMRCWIAGRPPVTNMFESVIWVALIIAILSIVFEMIYRKTFIALAGSVLAALTVLVAKSAPAVMDPFISPLEPVLRSNYWLTIHVLTITASYGSFALALGIGNVGLWYFLRGRETTHRTQLLALSQFMYRVMQVGVVLLAAGVILGGIWADYSWGRFWGWDPKETWALIALLGYLAVLHGRFAGWVKLFGFFAMTVLCFTLVVMAWYGVNFVLGVGLHSYGFSSGGVGYVASIVGIQCAYVACCWWSYKTRSSAPRDVGVN